MQKEKIHISESRLRSLYINRQLSIKIISKILDHDRSIISRELRKKNIPIRTKAEAIRLGTAARRIKKSILVDLYCKKNLTQKQIAKKLNRHPGNICLLMKYYGIETRNPDFYHTKYKKHNFSGNPREKSYMIGFRIGDLYVKLLPSERLITVGTTSTKNEQIALFRKLFSKYGNVWVSKKRADGNRYFNVLLNRSFDFLLYKKDFIPGWITTNNNFFSSFLAGYTDAEGCIFIAKNNVSGFRISSYEKNILYQIYKKLLDIGINCNVPKIHVKAGHKKMDGLVYQKDEWSIFINKKDQLLKILFLLKPLLKHSKRLRDLKMAERNIIRRNKKIK